jgi:calpain-15
MVEMPWLIERLFVSKIYNEEGVYRVKICKNGEWQSITIDDYFPCYPDGGPIFSSSKSEDLWVLILEKAYAKVHGTYFALRGGYTMEAVSDLTGCPCISYEF